MVRGQTKSSPVVVSPKSHYPQMMSANQSLQDNGVNQDDDDDDDDDDELYSCVDVFSSR